MRQWNVLDLDDLRTCGLTRQADRETRRCGPSIPEYRGVFALVPKLSLEACSSRP
jgi:hypothetical protein